MGTSFLLGSRCSFLSPAPVVLRFGLPATLCKRVAAQDVANTGKRFRSRVVATSVAGVEPPVPPTKTAERGVLDKILHPPDTRRYIFFGGKGGVGKTTTSAAAAMRCAEEGLTTLVISTDPAHSLGDALRVDLSDGRVHRVDDTLPLYAVESDAREAVDRFRTLVGSLKHDGSTEADATDASADSVNNEKTMTSSKNGEDASGGSDGWTAVADRLGLQEFSDVLQTIPPGADELIALVAVLDLVEDEHADTQFDRVIIDTAPTGHTLRLLTFPDFLDRFLEQAISLRSKLASARGIVGSVTRMFTGGKRINTEAALDTAAQRVAKYREKMTYLSDLFRDPTRTEFIVVTIATVLAVAESRRLIDRLWEEGVWVRHTVVNQILPASDTMMVDRYLSQVRKGQTQEIAFATEQIADEYGLSVSIVPRFDAEVRGVYGLQALGRVAFRDQVRSSYGDLFQPGQGEGMAVVEEETGKKDEMDQSRFVFVGGKGGVGKTSMSAALGVTLAAQGLKTLVLSTDPAHSLGDALATRLDGGAAVPIDGTDNMLCALEIDTTRAISEFQQLAKAYVAEGRRGVGVDVARKLGLEEFAGLLDNAPPGIDELVALTQVIDLVKYGDFDRVVVDTAPTGHTLRLLSFPEFLDGFLGKLVRLKQRLDAGIDAIRSMLGRRDGPDAVDKAARGVEKLRQNMVELKELVADHDRTQFVIVTVPTGLAMAESERLVKSLHADNVYVNNLIINQVVPDGSAAAFVDRIVTEQGRCMTTLRQACDEKKIIVVEVPYFDVEVRGLYGLKAMGDVLFSNSADAN